MQKLEAWVDKFQYDFKKLPTQAIISFPVFVCWAGSVERIEMSLRLYMSSHHWGQKGLMMAMMMMTMMMMIMVVVVVVMVELLMMMSIIYNEGQKC